MEFREIDLKQHLNKIAFITSVEKIYIFGSRAYKTGSTRSDVDLLIHSPNEEIPDSYLIKIIDEEKALDLFLTRDLKDARSVINSSHIFKDNLIEVLDAILIWSREKGVIQSAIDKLGVIRVRKDVDFKYSRFPLPFDPNKEAFHKLYGTHNVFMMMPFGDTTKKTYNTIKKFFKSKQNIKIIRADEHNFTGEVWSNVKLHMDCCEFGIALYNKFLYSEEKGEFFNPNVSLEAGYMIAQGKPVCILKDKALKNFFSDLASKYYYEYNDKRRNKTIHAKLQEWIDNENIPV